MAPTKSAGRVSIRVLPDSTRFREDLKRTLDRIENTMRVKIQVDPVFDRKQLAELKRQIEALRITIRPDIDLRVPTEEIAQIKEAIEAMDPMVEINAKANTAAAAARIRALTRDKMVQIWPIIHKAAVNNFTKHLAAISGASFISKEIEKGLRFLRTIDQHAIQLGKQALLLGGVISLVNGAVASILAVGDGLIQTVGILTVAPALASSLGIAIAVFVVALKDMKEVLGDLGPAFTQLASDMSFAFWDEAAQPIREMVNHLMPTLSEKMILASTSMGKLTGQIAKSYKEHVTIEKFATMFDRVVESMDTVRGAVDPIIEAFTILGMHGTKYLNRLSKSIVSVSEDFRDWLKVSEENGNLTRWTENAIQAFKDLGGIIKGVWNVFGALNSAMKEAGGPTLASLHQGLDNLAAMMAGPTFQTAMTGVFRGMFRALGDIGTAVAGLGPKLAAMAPMIELAFVVVGQTLATVIGYLGDIMSHPAVQRGLIDFLKGVQSGVESLAPAIEPFSVALGSLLTLMGTVFDNVGKLVSTIMTEWGPALQRLSDTFDTLAEPLRVMLEDVVRELTPAINELVDNAIIPLLEWIRDDLIPAVSQFARDVGPDMLNIAKGIADAINDHLIPALKWVTDLFKSTDGKASTFKATLESVKQLINDPENWVLEFSFKGLADTGGNLFKGMFENTRKQGERQLAGEQPYWIDRFGQWFIDLGKGLGKRAADMWNGVDWAPRKAGNNTFREGLQEKLDIFNDWANDANRNMEEWAAGVGDMISDAWDDSALGQALDGTQDLFDDWWGGLQGWWGDVETGWNNFWGGFGERNAALDEIVNPEEMQLATAGIDVDLAELMTSFSEWWTNATEGWDGFWTGFGETASTKWSEFKTGISEWWTGVSEGFGTWWEDIRTGWDEFWAGFAETASTKWEEFTTGISEWWTGVKEGFTTWWAEISEGWDTFWGDVFENTSTWWEDIKTTISDKFQEIKDGIVAKLTGIVEDIRTGWTNAKARTSEIWESIKAWLAQKWAEIKQGALNWLSGVGENIRNGWNNAKTITTQKWNEIKADISAKWDQIVSFIPGKLALFVAHVRNGFSNAKAAAREKMQELKQAVIDKAQEAIDWIKTLPQRLRNAITGGGSLEGSGSSLIEGFKQGMIAKANDAYEAVKGILQKIRNLFPASPAKEGPFSGKGWTPYSGAALIDGFAEGMQSRMTNATTVARQMASGVGKELSNVKYDPLEANEERNEGRSGNVSVKVYNPIAEPTSRTIARASSMIKLGGKP